MLLAALAGSTRAACVFFSNFGIAYSCRIIDIPATTGYGEPIQRLFKLKDGERIIQALSLDARILPKIALPSKRSKATEPPNHGMAISSDGYSLRFGLEPFVESSTRAGRRFARPAQGAEIVGMQPRQIARRRVCVAGDVDDAGGREFDDPLDHALVHTRTRRIADQDVRTLTHRGDGLGQVTGDKARIAD